MKFGLSNETYQKIKKVVEQYSHYQFKVFGSRARGDFKKSSDIDIAVEGNVTKEDKFKIANSFDLLDIPYEIDLVFIQDIVKPNFLASITKEGVVF